MTSADGKWWRGWKQPLTHTRSLTEEKKQQGWHSDWQTYDTFARHMTHCTFKNLSKTQLITAFPQLWAISTSSRSVFCLPWLTTTTFQVISVPPMPDCGVAVSTWVGVRWSVEGGRHQQEKMWDILSQVYQPQLHSNPSGRKNSVTALTVPLTTPHWLHIVIHHRKPQHVAGGCGMKVEHCR